MDLDVRRRQFRPGPEERADESGTDRQRSAAPEKIIGAHADAAQDVVVLVVDRADTPGLENQANLIMVLQIFADHRPVADNRNVVGGQKVRIAYSRQFQHLGRIDRAAAQDYLAVGRSPVRGPRAPVFDTAGAVSFEEDPFDMGLGFDPEVPP